MKDQSEMLSFTDLSLVAHLNDELRVFEQSHSLRCACRVVSVSKHANPSGLAWQVDFLGGKHDAECLKFVQSLISGKN